MSNQNYNEHKHAKTSVMFSPYDGKLVTIVLFLVVIGLLAIFSAGAPKCIIQGTSSTFFVYRQLAWFILGGIAMLFVSKVNYKFYDKVAIPFAWFIIVLLLGVHFFGTTVNGAQRWLTLGPIQFQPSEAAKLSVIMLLSSCFSRNINVFDSKQLKYFIPILIMIALIFKQPNLSMVIILLLSSMFMYFAAGGSIKLIVSTILLGVMGIGTMLQSYQKQRIMTWLNPDSDPYGAGYNIIQSMVAFSSGGFFGVGFGNSKQKLSWLPEGHTDFIFAIIGEEFGFVGCFFFSARHFLFVVLVNKDCAPATLAGIAAAGTVGVKCYFFH